MSSYDQWKTASPYDDEPDITEWLEKTKANVDAELYRRKQQRLAADDQTILLQDCAAVIEAAATFIEENV